VLTTAFVILFFLIPVFLLPSHVRNDAFSRTYYYFFGLNSVKDTVAEYKNASFDTQHFWLENACKNGGCLLEIDWSCGFTNGNLLTVQSCIIDEIREAEIWMPLDAIRKSCGRRYMHFVGERYSKKEKCNGRWGELN
jgi:hypothetical protein